MTKLKLEEKLEQRDKPASQIEFAKTKIETVEDLTPALEEMRTQIRGLDSMGLLNGERLQAVAEDLKAIITRGQDLAAQTEQALEIAKAIQGRGFDRKGVDGECLRTLVQGVTPDEELHKIAGVRVNANYFGLISQLDGEVRFKGADDATAARLAEFRMLNDIIFVQNKRLGVLDPGGYMSRGGPRSLPQWARYQELAAEFQRGLNETNASDGLNWVPTLLSSNLVMLIQAELRLMGFFETTQMGSLNVDNVVEGADLIGYYIGEGTADDGSIGSITSSQFTALKFSLIARKIAARCVTSKEWEEDSVVGAVNEITRKVAKALRRAVESCSVSGQRDAVLDAGIALAATDNRKAWNGIRYAFNQTGGTVLDGGAGVTADLMLAAKGSMNAYGLDPTSGLWLTGFAGYARLLSLKDSANFAVVLTQDKMGPNSTFQKGQLGEAFGSPVVVSEFVPQNMDASAKISAAGLTRTALYYVNRDAFRLGERRGATIEGSPHVLFNSDQLVFKGTGRWDFKPAFTPSATDKSVACIGNLVTF